jgi:hypothetical protein
LSLVAIAGIREQTQFQYGLGQLLNKQWYPIGARHDLLDDLLGSGLSPVARAISSAP